MITVFRTPADVPYWYFLRVRIGLRIDVSPHADTLQRERPSAVSYRVLIVDNHEIERRGIRALLEGVLEWKVCGEAQSGSEAIEMALSLRPDLILMRVNLPDLNAAEVIPKITHLCPAIKILGMAMEHSGELAARAVAAGASGLTMTSDTESDLLLALHNIGKDRPYFSPQAVRLLQGQLSKGGTSKTLPADLTERETEILRLLANGRTNKKIAESLGISIRTVEVHRSNIMRKLNLVTYSDLVLFAVRHGMVEM
jgi:DNA-binding NarL/FixJ family response regulator